jgi:hypothetical protein
MFSCEKSNRVLPENFQGFFEKPLRVFHANAYKQPYRLGFFMKNPSLGFLEKTHRVVWGSPPDWRLR